MEKEGNLVILKNDIMNDKMILKQFLLLPLLFGFILLSCQDEVVGGMENKVENVKLNE